VSASIIETLRPISYLKTSSERLRSELSLNDTNPCGLAIVNRISAFVYFLDTFFLRTSFFCSIPIGLNLIELDASFDHLF
jgi:hypothetical protein